MSIIFQPYKWEYYETDELEIYIYGLTEDEKSVVVKITDFRPFIFLELDSTIKWSLVNQEILKNYLRGILKDNPPKKLEFVETQLAYYYTDAKFMKIHLNTTALIKRLENAFKKPTTIGGLGSNLNFIVHEQKATPLLQICDVQKIIPSGWLKVPNIPSEEEENFSTSDIEIMTSYKNLKFVEKEGFTNPKILSMDLECTSQDISGNTFPYYKNKGDEIICICCTVGRFLDKPNKWKTYALVNATNNNECNRKAINNIDLDSQKCYRLENFDNEKDLILGYKDLLNEINPDVIVTFNGLSFDEKYMYKRAKLNMCWQKFSKMGKLIDKPARHEKMKWHSQAYGDQEFNYLNIPGRLHIDMYPVISKEYNNLMSYNLDYLSEYFLGDHKDDLPPPEMIRLYHQGGHMERIVKYCNKDTFLPFKLIQNNRLNSWVGLMEMTNITYVQMFDLIIRGQQLKMFSQVYIKCHELGLVVDSKWSHYKPKESEKGIVGATVQNPKKGLWDLVPTLDFSSLYPSTIIAHNICFSTWIPPWKTVPKEHYNEVPCSEHKGCECDKTIRKTKIKKNEIICRDNIYKYYKPEIKKGIVPMILENLIANRNKAKKKIGEYAALLKIETDPQKRKELEEKISQQDKRQLGLKISANSIYGGFSSEYSYTPFFQGGSTTTAVGRTSIDAAINFITKTVPDAVIVYGDSVTGDTPILLLNPEGDICIKKISELGAGQWETYDNFKSVFTEPINSALEYHVMDDGPQALLAARHMFNSKERWNKERRPLTGWKVWTDQGWSEIKQVIRHNTNKKIYRITTHTGTVDVTQDHSLLTPDLKEIKPVNVKIGDELLHSFPTEFQEKEPLVLGKYILTEEEARVWGFFMNNGDCYKLNNEHFWLLKSSDKSLLNAYKDSLEKIESCLMFEMNTAGVFAWGPGTDMENLLHKYKTCLYSLEGEKIIPNIILNGPINIKKAFWDGYFHAPTSITAVIGEHGNYEINKDNKLINQMLWLLAKQIGVDFFDQNTMYLANPPNLKNKIKKIEPFGKQEGYVYDIETECGRFQAGIGEMIVKNTDSSLIHFKTCKTMEECYERAKKLVEEVNKLFPPPMKMELEKIYWRYFLLSKKRYIGYKIDKDGNVIEKDKKGIVTKRRDGCEFLRDVYNKLIDLVMVKTPKTELYKYLAVKLQELLNHQVPIEKLTMVKSIKDNYKAKNLPHLVVANKMKTRGKYVVSGTRIQYVFIETLEKRAPQYKRVEDPDHVKENKEIKLDYLYYLEKQLAKPIDELFSVAYKTDNILLHLTKLLKINATTDILGYFNPKFRIEEE